jgi:hypothetical protein
MLQVGYDFPAAARDVLALAEVLGFDQLVRSRHPLFIFRNSDIIETSIS